MGVAFHYSVPDEQIVHKGFQRYMEKVCEDMEMDVLEILGFSRRLELCNLRHLLMTIAYHEFGLTVTTVGKIFNKDHTTITYAKGRMETYLSNRQVLQARPHLHKCVLSADRVFFNEWGHNFNHISKWLIQAKSVSK